MSSLASKQGPRIRHITGEEEPYETIAVEKLTPIIGAEISGVDIGKLFKKLRGLAVVLLLKGADRYFKAFHGGLVRRPAAILVPLVPNPDSGSHRRGVRCRPLRFSLGSDALSAGGPTDGR